MNTQEHDHSHLESMDMRVRALETLLIQKGYVDPAALDHIVETYETTIGPHNGAAVVARAWVDPAFRDWLLLDATTAIASLGFGWIMKHVLHNDRLAAVQIGGGLMIIAALICYFLIKEKD